MFAKGNTERMNQDNDEVFFVCIVKLKGQRRQLQGALTAQMWANWGINLRAQ